MKQINTMFNRSSKSVLTTIATFVLLIASQSCSDYLDVVPDDVPTLDKAFALRSEAEKYLFTCYSYLPKDGDVNFNIGMLSGDEICVDANVHYGIEKDAIQIALGGQSSDDPIQNVWDGSRLGAGSRNSYRLFNGIRECNVFLENVRDLNKVPDLTSSERERWIGEVEFLKAYYHFYLLRMYGPIPIIDTNVTVDASDAEINVKREPVDDCVNYIVKTLDDATAKLPTTIANPVTESGRITKTIALGIKAKVLLMAASPLFNGNSDMSSLKNKDGKALFNPTPDINKWKLAADAALVAIQSAETNGSALFTFQDQTFTISDVTRTQMSIRQAVCERWNPEIIWGNPNSNTGYLQQLCLAPLSGSTLQSAVDALKILSVPVKIAEMFYSKNGVPIKEDNTLDFSDVKLLRRAVAVGDEKYNIRAVKTTARLNFDREPRFYADLGFDTGIWYKYDSPTKNDLNTWYLEGLFGNPAGSQDALRNNVTGYFVKKLVDWKSSIVGSVSYNAYPWPEMRLADLYLMYAEALNEFSGPTQPVYDYLDRVRARAGLKGVVESWANFSSNPGKPGTISGLRAIIHQERTIELAFEGHRYWDLLRWKEASTELNKAVIGWNVTGKIPVSYYQFTTVFQQKFVAPRDYFWPIPQAALNQNPNLVQNIGW
jgi:hypothetical protein